MKNLINLFSWILAKCFSARFIVTLMFVYTYCRIIEEMIGLLERGIIKVETFLGVMAGFTPLVILIVQWYFQRKDRQSAEGEQLEDNTTSTQSTDTQQGEQK